ncbi:MAG: acyl-CoA dehydrogenase family protein [Dehalococcoidia bacterium]|nr:acyl-CoA dehydrogenase family protein [Dehalococcoidia bacterium]
MDFTFSPEEEAFRAEVRAFCQEHVTDEVRLAFEPGLFMEPVNVPVVMAFRQKLIERGWPFMHWPVEWGGQGKSSIYPFILSQELGYYGVYGDDPTFNTIGPVLMQFGADETKRELLPRMARGEVNFAQSYSEPNAGTDLASLQTRAARQGDDYVLNGHKMWSTAAHRATHLFVAARTDPEQPRHKGISMFLVPADAPGVTIRPIWTPGTVRTNDVFLDDVRVPATLRVGNENEGWYCMMVSLDYERIISFEGWLRRRVEELLEAVRTHQKNGRPLAEDPVVRRRVARLVAKYHMARLMSLRNAWLVEGGDVTPAPAAMEKIWVSDLHMELLDTILDLTGEDGLASGPTDAEPGGGRTWDAFATGHLQRFGGGTNDALRTVIATRGMGLPR